MTRTLRRGMTALLVLMLMFALQVRPEATQAQSPRMEAAVRASQGRAALRRGEVVEAIRLFREALSLGADGRVWRELATVLEQEGNRREASAAWARYAALARSEEEHAMAAERSDNLRRAPASLRVRVEPAAAARQARVWFDHDVPRAVPVGGAEAIVEGGVHRVRVESVGYLPFESMVTTAFGEAQEVLVTMRPAGIGRPDGGRGRAEDSDAGSAQERGSPGD